jgi:hypothetical protein
MHNQVKTVGKRARSSELTIRINIDNAIGMNKIILETLKNPSHLNFWRSESESVFAISAADEPTDMSIPIPGFFYNTRNGSKIRNWKLMKVIRMFAGWNDESIHLLVGELIPELNMVAFRAKNI